MGKFFNKNKSNNQEPEDFVLFKPESDDSTPTPTPQVDNEFQDTASIDTTEIESVLSNKPTKDGSSVRKKNALISFIASHRILSICIAAILAIAIISISAVGIITVTSPLHGYAQVAAEKGNIMRTMQAEGTLTSGDKYEITSLVSGSVTASEVEVGDTVKKNDILYKIDDTDAKLAVERAENEVSKASGENSSTYRILASEAGKVQSLTIKTGSTVTPGSQVGTIKRADGTITSITSYISGTVTVVSVRTGQSLSAGQVIATVNATSPYSSGNTVYDKKSAELDLKSAKIQLDNCTIKSPVDGIVIEKNIKVGDNVGITDSDKPMMIILDTSSLNFSFMVDEKRVLEVEKGQTVSVTCDSVPDATFSGEVSSVSHEGVMNDANQLMFEVTVSVKEPDGLKAGMKVSATVVLDSKNKVLSIPEKALMESDGQKALVLLKSDDELTDSDLSESLENQLNYPWIKVPKGCQLITVKYGLSDGINTEILSGLKPGDIVVYDPDNKSELVLNLTNDTKAKPSAPDKQTDFSVDNTPDIEAEQAIEDEIEKILQNSNSPV